MPEEIRRTKTSGLLALVGAALLGGAVVLVGVVVLYRYGFLSQEQPESGEEKELVSSEQINPKDFVRLCDESAADPDDPRKTFDVGIYLDEFTHNRRSPHEALNVCEQALNSASTDDQPRIHYQLARLALYLDRVEQAERHLVVSQAAGYPAANFAVAQLFYERGKQSDSVDYAMVIAALRIAAENGHLKAAAMMARVLDEEFPTKGYQLPGLMRAIYDGRLGDVPDDLFTRSVNIAIYQHLKDYCKQFEASVVTIISDAEVSNYSIPLQVNSAINGIVGFFDYIKKLTTIVETFNNNSDLGGLIPSYAHGQKAPRRLP